MAIIPYRFDAALSDAFLALHSACGSADPSQQAELRHHFSPDFAFHLEASNDHRHFLATAGGKTVGHVTAFTHHALCGADGRRIGGLGHFCCINDRAVSQDLLGAATDWLRAAHGLHRIWGPIDFDVWHGYRFRTNGFQQRPFLGEPRNPPWYPDHFAGFGLQVVRRWHSLELRGPATIHRLVGYGGRTHKRALADAIRFTCVEPTDTGAMGRLHRTVMRAFTRLEWITPVPFGEFARLTAAKCSDPRFVVLASQDGRDLGCAVAYPDPPQKRLVLYLLGVALEAETAVPGLGCALVYRILETAVAAGYPCVVFALMWRPSWSGGIVGRKLATARRTYALYELALEGSPATRPVGT